VKGDECGDWFDRWIDTYRNPDTKLYANTWSRWRGGSRNVVAINENGNHASVYDMERSNA